MHRVYDYDFVSLTLLNLNFKYGMAVRRFISYSYFIYLSVDVW